ncbi:hypothetical protein [Pseudomonas sp. BF-R-01]|uniref:hypothetical protein n=1 Tax=Pseudomonas sp. BF-R-01 TaxID=2832365 RepID=UPI001CC011F9|nr:hypothetical protein [Pseudomonas sp. BF-R-01]
MADHLFNFCVTNSSLRDWVLQSRGIVKDDPAFGAYHKQWRQRANGYFGECADIANASKHLVIKKAGVGQVREELVALGPHGAVEGSKTIRDSFEISLSDGSTIDLLMFIHKICTEWESIFSSDTDLMALPSHGEFLFTWS